MRIILGDSLQKLKDLPTSTIDAVVTDPPYGWRFMGKAWDWDGADIERMAKQSKRPGETYVGIDGSTRKCREDANMAAGKYEQSLSANQSFNQLFQEWTALWATEAYRVLKPGGHMLVFCGPRTYHRMASGAEDAGFEIRDQLQWLFGSGFPKSHNIGDGWGTALKPANEPIVLARKPLGKGLTVAQNVEKWGTGALNVDASRIGSESVESGRSGRSGRSGQTGFCTPAQSTDNKKYVTGRWPANVLFDEEAALGLGENARYFYCAKTSKRERNAGLEGMPEILFAQSGGAQSALARGETEYHTATQSDYDTIKKTKNHHPTVKPIKLMEYLCTLITPPGGIILDPFMGSGSTGCAAVKLGYQFIGIEREAEYIEIAKRRIEHWSKESEQLGLANG